MNYSTLSSLGSLTLNSQIVTSVDIGSGIDDSVLSNYFDKRIDNTISHDVTLSSFNMISSVEASATLADELAKKQDQTLSASSGSSEEDHIKAVKAAYYGFDLSIYNAYQSSDRQAKLKFPVIMSDQTIATKETLSDSLDGTYFNKNNDNDVNGKTVFKSTVKIVSSDFIQTSEEGGAVSYGGKNGFIQAEAQVPYGKSSIGSLGYCILGVMTNIDENNAYEDGFVLSGDISKLCAVLNNDLESSGIGADSLSSISLINNVLGGTSEISNIHFSFALYKYSASMKYTLKRIDGNTVYFNEPLQDEVRYIGLSEDKMIELWLSDDNAFYAAGLPDLGNQPVPNFYAQHAEGGAVRAIGKYTHAEGRDNIADVRYAHVEGSHNAAGEMASHAEGFRTSANGRYSHSEGTLTKAVGQSSHAEGESTVAYGKNSHAGGWSSKAYGDWSFAQGRYAEASSFSTIAMGAYVSAYATNTIAMGTYALADHRRAFVWNGLGDSPASRYYSSNGESTFNINPLSGSKGFYIGLSSLDDYLKENIVSASDYIKDHELSDYAKTSELDEYVKEEDLDSYAQKSDLDIYAKEDSLSSYMKTVAAATMSQEMYGWVNNSGQWAGYTPGSNLGDQYIKFVTVPVHENQQVTIHACAINKAKICFLSGDFNPIPVQGSKAPLVGVAPYNNVISANSISTVIVPANATMLFCCSNWRGVKSLPEISVDNVHVESPSQIGIKIHNLHKSIAASSSCTSNKFNKNDKDNVNNVMIQVGVDGDYEFKNGSNVWGVTHFIPCKKDNVLVASRIKPQNNSHRVVVRGIQYFDFDFNQIRVQQSSSLTGMTDFREIPSSELTNRNTWWTQISDDNCEYVKLVYAYQDEVAHTDMSSYFMVQVEPSSYVPHEIVEYIPFENKISDKLHSSWNGKRILFAGDSITQPSQTGYSSADYASMSKGEFTNKTYVNFACEKLNCNWIETSSIAWGGAMLALSSPNAQTSGRRSLVTNLSSWSDDIDAVHIMIGTNDWNYAWPDLGSFNDLSDINYDNLSTFYGALGYACRELLEKYPGKPIAFSTPIKRWKDGGFDELSNIAPSKGWITNSGTWNNGAYQYKLIPILYPNLEIEIKGSSHPSCDTWYTFLSCWPRISEYVGVYAPTSSLSAYTPGQNRIARGTVKTFTSPPIPSYLWVTYSRNDDPTIYGSDAGNAWPTYIKINGIDVTASGYKVPYGLRYDMPNSKGNTLDEFVKAIKDVCGYYGVKVIDLFNECPINPMIQSHRDILIPDGTHPSPKGHQLIAKYVAGAFNEVID